MHLDTNRRKEIGMRLDYARRLHWLGYLNLLKHSQPNGRLNHAIAQLQTTIKMNLSMGLEPPAGFETRVKHMVHQLYPEQGEGSNYTTA